MEADVMNETIKKPDYIKTFYLGMIICLIGKIKGWW